MNNNHNFFNASRGSASSTNTNNASRRNRPTIRRQEDRTRTIQQNVARLPVFDSLNQEQQEQLVADLSGINVYEMPRNNSESSLSTGSVSRHNLEAIQEGTAEQDNHFNEIYSMMSISTISFLNNDIHLGQRSVDNPHDETLQTQRIIRYNRIASTIDFNENLADVFNENDTNNNQNNMNNTEQPR
jgi:hypothetical protein